LDNPDKCIHALLNIDPLQTVRPMGNVSPAFLILTLVSSAIGYWIIGRVRPRPEESTFSPQNLFRSASVGEECWFPGYYCSIDRANRVSGVLMEGNHQGVENCYNDCKANDDCKYFTWFTRRGRQMCFQLKSCDTDHRIKDDSCLSRGACTSGPSDCAASTANRKCPQLQSPGGKKRMQWQCEDGKEGFLVNPYAGQMEAGTRCLLSCYTWASKRRQADTDKGGNLLFRGFIFSICQPDGSWTDSLPNDFRDGVVYLSWPHPQQLGVLKYPTPDNPPPNCLCRISIVLTWPPLGFPQPAFYYDPRREPGAFMECEDEVARPVPGKAYRFEIETHNICRYFCDTYLVSTVKCEDGKWTGNPENGFYCWSRPTVNDSTGAHNPGVVNVNLTQGVIQSTTTTAEDPWCLGNCSGVELKQTLANGDSHPWMAIKYPRPVEIREVNFYHSDINAITVRNCTLCVANRKPVNASVWTKDGTWYGDYVGPGLNSGHDVIYPVERMPLSIFLVIQCSTGDTLHFKNVSARGVMP